MNEVQQGDDSRHPNEQAYENGVYVPSLDPRVDEVVARIVPLMAACRAEVRAESKYYRGDVSLAEVRRAEGVSEEQQQALQLAIYELAKTLEAGQ